MADENKNSCENCKYFSDGLSEKGYCKLYHHNLTEPERICSRFEQKEEKRKDSPIEADYTKNAPETGQLKYKNNKRLLYLIGIVSIFILSIALLLVDIVFAVELHPHLIPLPVKIGTCRCSCRIFVLCMAQHDASEEIQMDGCSVFYLGIGGYRSCNLRFRQCMDYAEQLAERNY